MEFGLLLLLHDNEQASAQCICQTAESFSEGNAVLLVYLVDEGEDIYIGVLDLAA